MDKQTYREQIRRMYEEALKEENKFIRTLRLAFCLVMVEDKELLGELAKH